MKDEEILRKQAIELRAQGFSITAIADKLEKTRQWVHKWLKRYKIENDNWFIALPNTPKKLIKSTSSEVENAIIFIRKSLNDQKYAQKGALNILYELGRMNIAPPSIVTINRIIKRNGLLDKGEKREAKKKNTPPTFLIFNRWISLGPDILKEDFGIIS
jgi:site-specific recombinase XerD